MLKIIKMICLSLTALTLTTQVHSYLPPSILGSGTTAYRVTVTAYANHPKCTGNREGISASTLKLTPKHNSRLIALSRDIGKNHDFGEVFQLWVKDRVYVVSYLDRMPNKHRKKVDLLLPSLKSCREFGRQQGVLLPVGKS